MLSAEVSVWMGLFNTKCEDRVSSVIPTVRTGKNAVVLPLQDPFAEVGFDQVYDFVAAMVEHGFDQVHAETFGLIEIDGGRHGKFLAGDFDGD